MNKPGGGAGVKIGGPEAMRNVTEDGLTNPVPNMTGV